jgi:hypothetical protein
MPLDREPYRYTVSGTAAAYRIFAWRNIQLHSAYDVSGGLWMKLSQEVNKYVSLETAPDRPNAMQLSLLPTGCGR